MTQIHEILKSLPVSKHNLETFKKYWFWLWKCVHFKVYKKIQSKVLQIFFSILFIKMHLDFIFFKERKQQNKNSKDKF